MPAMAGKWPQETGHSQGNDHVPLNEVEKLRVGGPDKAGKRQPELPSEQKNGKGSKQGNAERIFKRSLGRTPFILAIFIILAIF
jgi:hypothetical protein